MSWGETHDAGTGSTGQIAEAHRALDAVGVRAGPLALRVLAAAGRIDGQREALETLQAAADRWQVQADTRRNAVESAALLAEAVASNHPSPPAADAPGAAERPENDDPAAPATAADYYRVSVPGGGWADLEPVVNHWPQPVPRCSCGIGLLGIPSFRRPRCLWPECPNGVFADEIDAAADPCRYPHCPNGSEPDPAHE